RPWLSTYASFTEGLERGPTATPTDTNKNEIFPPTIDKQYEVGAKASIDKLLLTLALFKIDRQYAFDRDNGDHTTTTVVAGRQVHDGIELGVSGKLTEELTLGGGVTFMNPRVTHDPDPSIDGKRPAGVSSDMAKLYAEYAVPSVKGWVLTGAVQH